ncbi:MAG: hypothetical protein OEY18_09345 [Candidatus Aminicenantes bacterium]|nr:hypothetical protein [Candidatus Aminicenantes bacterium]MDH5384900.1 hypothetical protein [Candidatus Aminicenantes bacterium]
MKARYGKIRFRVVDVTCMAYFSLIGLLLIFFHKSVPNWPLYVVLHVVLVLSILEIVRWGEINRHKKILWFLRLFYPIAILLIAWFELDGIIPMLFGNYWATDVIIRVEKSMFGVLPNVWFEQFYRPLLCYPVALKILKSRNEDRLSSR